MTYVVSREVMNWSLGQHAVVLKLRLAERGGVASNNDQLGLARSQTLQSALIAKDDFAGLHNQRQARVLVGD